MTALVVIVAIVAAYFIGRAVQFIRDANNVMDGHRCCCGRHH